MPLLEINNLKVYFPIRGGILGRVKNYVRAVDSVSLSIEPGQTYGLVGESGSGKTTTGKAIVGLARITGGTVKFEGKDITRYIGKNHSPYRRGVQMIFQDAYSSLNPVKRIYDIIAEPIRNFEKLTPAEERKKIDGLLDIVGMTPDNSVKYPHEFSGGQRQRIGIARAIALKPKLIIADEPVSALDLSVQAQVLNYFKDIQQEFKLAYLFISHDMGVVKHMCENIAIMHRGRFVERGTKEEVYESPVHIYTKRLMAAIPDPNPDAYDENVVVREKIAQEYESGESTHYDKDGRVYDLKPVSGGSGNGTHYAAIP